MFSIPFIIPEKASLVLATSLLTGALVFTGCATRPYLRGQATSTSIGDAANAIDNSRRQLTDTTMALSALVNQPMTNLRPAFERYRSAVSNLERAVDAVNSEANKMQQQGQQYFDHWNASLAEMKSEDIRARSIERQREVADQFTGIQQQYQQVQQQFAPLMSTFRDIQRMLGADLTPAGVNSVREFAERTENTAKELRQTLDQLADKFRETSGVLSQEFRPAE
jgi:chromosome segregation ATPase